MTVFNATQGGLENSKLVEAGAGTGKTFSIAILTLRLIIEKEMPIQKILLVTFTEAAAAELEARIRKFVRLAYNYCNGIDIGGENQKIMDIVGDQNGRDNARPLLERALLSLDETSIGTIHSFCHKTLTEFAFETGQIYGTEPLKDLTEVITDEVNDYWRNHIAVLEKDLFKPLKEIHKYQIGLDWYEYLSRDTIVSLIKEILNGKEFVINEKISRNDFLAERIKLKNELKEIIENRADLEERINTHISVTNTRFTDLAKNKLIEQLNNTEEFLHYLNNNADKNVKAIFSFYKEKEAQLVTLNVQLLDSIFAEANKEITPNIIEQILDRNQLSFDDMIQNLHKAVCNEHNETLRTLLRNKFDAVFIDEFQDTDKHQYEIFNTLFGQDKVLFYIGDPKQAIYGWRMADINTYFSARTNVGNENIYEMDKNFRSSIALVNAFNEFFGQIENPFYDQSINYFNVSANEEKEQKSLFIGEAILRPITVYDECQNIDEINQSVIDLVKSLLVKGRLGNDQVKPHNIAIIVRSNYEGTLFKNAFEKRGIPAIQMFDEKIFNTEEAKYVLFFLQAIADISITNIKKALLTPFTGFNTADIANINSDMHVELFKAYSNTIQKDGVYACLSRFITDYKVRETLLKADNEGGQRKLSNLLQLAEVLQDAQQNKKLDETELIAFLKKGINGMQVDGDEYVQRLETDNDALKIVTIHKSKGLEYDIVIAPFLDMQVKTKGAFSSFRDENESYKFASNRSLDDGNLELFKFQSEQENRRLIYVAVTRAKYQCFLFKKSTKGDSSLDPFYSAISETSKFISKEEYVMQNENFAPEGNQLVYHYPENVSIELSDNNWCKMSFSFLGGKHGGTTRPASTKEMSDYGKFIFQDLERGMNAGNLLHDIFEFIDFTDNNTWKSVIEKSLDRFIKKRKEEFQEPLAALLDNILNTPINIAGENILLSEVSNSQKLNEMEFDMNMSGFSVGALNGLSDETRTIRSINVGELYGVLNGLMDLFFEYNGKYYILDWKSNYLGDSLEDYTPDKLNEAMNENNYHLQYMIYTYAADRFLKSRMPGYEYDKHFGGVIYLFLRGVRKDKETGIFVNRPTKDDLEMMDKIFSLEKPETSNYNLNKKF